MLAETDGLPGVFIDRYEDVACVHLVAGAMETRLEAILDGCATVPPKILWDSGLNLGVNIMSCLNI